MRVDWGSGGSILGPVDIGLASYSQATDYVRETETFDPDQLQVTEDYIQITQMVTVSDGGMTCYYTFGNFNCGSGEGRVRLSFAKIDPQAEYAPRECKDLVEFRDEEGQHMRKLYLGVPLERPTEGKEFHCTPELIEFLNGRSDVRQDYTRGLRRGQLPAVWTLRILPFGAFRYDRQLGGATTRTKSSTRRFTIFGKTRSRTDGSKNEKPLVDRKPKTINAT